MYAVATRNLGKTYTNGVQGLKGLTLQIEKGSIFGFLGPNGSGKTTTVRLLNGTLTPTAGSAEVLGLSPDAEAARLRTSTIAELARMYDSFSVFDNLFFFSELYGLSKFAAGAKIEELLTSLQLWEKRGEKLGTFSTGMQKRVYLARTLLNDPEVVFLDEPTSGLDPESALQVTELIHSLASQHGTTVFLCTHNLPLAERICDAYGFLSEGELVASGTGEKLARDVGAAKVLGVTTREGEHKLEYRDEADINGIIRGIMDQGEHVQKVKVVRPDLETIYFHYIRRHGERAKD
jgi:ABC-2 type transport system ATP-binding protein